MTSYGYQLFTFGIHKPRQPDNLILGELLHPSDSEQARTAGWKNDSLYTIYGVLHGAEGRRIDSGTKHLTIKNVTGSGRCIRFTAEVGTSGQTSVFKDPHATTPVFERGLQHIESGDHRGLLVVPARSRRGLLVLEARGRATGRPQIEALLKTSFRTHGGLVLDLAAIADSAALSAYIDRAAINAVTLKKHSLPPDVADYLDVPETERDYGGLELKINPGRARRFARTVVEKFRGEGPTRRGLLEMHQLHFDELQVKMDDGDRKVTLTVEADMAAPTFTYHLETSAALTDDQFYSEVLETVPGVAHGVGVMVRGNWQSEPWPDEMTQLVLDIPGSEVSDDGDPPEGS